MNSHFVFGLFMFILTGKCMPEGDFGYDGMKGPSHWANELHYDSCDGKLQSPIDIQEHTVIPIRFPPLKFSGFDIHPKTSVLTNNGHTVMFQFKTKEFAVASGGPLNGEYVFSQLHFHWGGNDSYGSEDRINNHSFPMELHMVLYKLEYGDVTTAMRFQDGLAVFAVFYESSLFKNAVYAEVVEHLGEVVEPNTKVELKTPLTLDSLLPANKYHYFTYNGSLTTPPCSEVVTWLDFKEPIYLSKDQIAAFRELKSPDGELTHNFRPIQPTGSRTVYYNLGERPFVLEDDDYLQRSPASMLSTGPFFIFVMLLTRLS